MLVELVGRSFKGVMAMARAQGASMPRSATRRGGVWYVRVVLPVRA